ncbi:DUF397 domain-containing protein [Streptomyces sp. M19]
MRTILSPEDLQWRKSSYSGDEGSSCVEIARLSARVAIRDSKIPEAAAFTVTPPPSPHSSPF